MKVTKDISYAAVLCVLVYALFCAVYGREGRMDWGTPVRYEGDAIAFLTQLKAARDGYVVPVAATFVPDLNAPFEANWNDYPQPQKALFWLAGRLSWPFGLFVTANLLVLLAHLLAALSFYGVARYLRARPLWAAVGGAVFAATPYIWYRSLDHLALAYYWHLPPALLVTGWCFRPGGVRLRSRRFLACAVVAVVVGLFNVYYAALFVQLLALGALAQAVRRRWDRVGAPLVLVGLAVFVPVLEGAGTMIYVHQQGANPYALRRAYFELDLYALRPLELMLPPYQGILHVAAGGARYWEQPHSEHGAVYVGVVALCGLGLLFGRPTFACLRRRRVFLSSALGAVVWILALSIAAGINGFIGLFGMTLLRGTSRYSIWLCTIALLYLVGRLSRLSLRPTTAAALAAALLVVAVADQFPPTWAEPARRERRFQSDRAFTAQLEAALPGPAMVFMMPVVEYPEAGRTEEMPDYDLFRPYLFTSHLRYSYGSDRGRPREAWQGAVADLPPGEMVDRLERYGFSGIVIGRLGYADRGRELLHGLAAAGRPMLIDDRQGQRAFVPLHPRSPIERP
jgi:hypothetical protein